MNKKRKFSPHVKWTSEELQLLSKEYAVSTRSLLKELFPSRSIESIEAKANAIGLSKPNRKGRTAEQVLASKRESMARRRSKNPDAARAYQMQNYRLNRHERIEKTKLYQRRRFFWIRATKLKSRVNAIDLARLWKNQRGRCAMTGRRLNRENAHLDHIIAKARGGSDDLHNLRWLCKEANLALRELSDDEFLALCSDVMNWIGQRIRNAN